jgi:germination protein M
MKRFYVFFLAALIAALLTGCSIPFFGGSSGGSDKNGGNDMIGLDDSQDGSGIAAAGDNSDPVSAPESGREQHHDDTYSSSVSEGAGDHSAGLSGSVDHSMGSSGSGGNDTVPSGTGVLSAERSSGVTYSEPRRPVTVYYQDEDGCIIPVTRWIQPQLGIARAAVSLAIDSPLLREETTYYGVYPVIPEGTEILGIDIRNGTAVIDFSRHLLSYGTAWSERNIIASIVYTLTEFETVDRVRILINGYSPGVLKYGADLSDALGREDLMINTGTSLSASGKDKLDVYFMKKANDSFVYAVPVSLAVGSGGADMTPDTLIRLLFGTDPESGIYTEIPDGAYLKSSYVYNGTAFLDFSGEFLNYGGTAREEAILKQIAYTLRQCSGIRKINITVEGRSVDLPEGTYISSGITIPAVINDVMDRG